MEVPVNERIASVEVKLQFIHELLKEIKEDVKDLPTKEEYAELKDRVSELEGLTATIKVKVFAASIIVSFIGSGLGVYLIQLIMGK